ncbi:MAG: serine/threonine-protein kinase [Candidatus Acidiferrales bacterium]
MVESSKPGGPASPRDSARPPGPRDTVLLSDVPDAAEVAAESPLPASASLNLSSTALAALNQRYEILASAGHGSMGNVYKARDRETGETVALKLLKPEIASDQAMMDRFKNELLFARKITHKNVCRVYEFNRLGGIAYTSMEFVEGESLRSVLNRFGGLPQRKAVDLALQICSGLKEAHAQGIVHRDLKPENVMIDAQGNVKIMDFGIARSMEAGTRLTGSMVGTPAYMAPEQVAGKPADYRTDIYSLGLMLYEMFTGSPAFRADNPVAVALKQMREEPPLPREVEPNVPVSAERIILKCLEKEPERRFQTVADLESALKSPVPMTSSQVPARAAATTGHISSGLPRASVAVNPAAKRKSPVIWILATLVLVAAVLSGLHALAVMKAYKLIQPPAASPAPKPPDFAYKIPAPPPPAPAPVVEDAKPAAPQAAVPATTPAPTPVPAPVAKSSVPADENPERPTEVFPRMETGPARKKNQSLAKNPSTEGDLPPAPFGSTYLFVQRFEREDKAQGAIRKITQMDLPAQSVIRNWVGKKYFVVFCGPIENKRASSVTQRLEEKGFSNVRSVGRLAGNRNLK